MGDFRVVMEATGGHGCQREVGDGEKVFGCRRMDCPDCLTQEYVEKMSKIASVSKAELIHWPSAVQWGGQSVVDEYKPSTMKINSYTVKTLNGTSPDEGKEHHYVDWTPPHRVRKGYFPDHPSLKNSEPK